MINKLLWTSILFICLLPFLCIAQEYDSKTFKHEFQIMVGFNSQQAAELEPAYSYMFMPNIGVITGVNLMLQLFEKNPLSTDDSFHWKATQERALAIQLRPSLRFRFPLLREENNSIILLNIEPGVLINLIPNETLTFAYINDYYPFVPPAKYESIKNKGGETISYQAKGYLSVNFNYFQVSIGYAYSNFDIYTGRRNIVIETESINDKLWKRRATNTFFITLGFAL
ncbi:hypothetical protein AGMMS49574_08810 [Bacteroidia bacterium]|nr:hypothetical protein AGMMS49574_08810 [Bacteroidia bacterium]GHU57928.1 hypothetical protein FACS189411_12470 [Bacteroidia bacterium]GHV03994.1 hypothetical protein FACS189416_1410 [Bacteroidia bacterium]